MIFFLCCTIVYQLLVLCFITSFSVRLSLLSSYYIPRDGPKSSYKDYISMLPPTEDPELFGQHPNADIASQIAETRTLFDTLLSLQPQVASSAAVGARPSREEKVRAKQRRIRVDQRWIEIRYLYTQQNM